MESAGGDCPGTSADAKVEDNSLGRLLALSDGVFAIAMTLLALDLRVPELGEHSSNDELFRALSAELPSFLTYILSFYVVASYWFAHHRLMRSVVTTHPRLLAHTLPLLLLIAALPFPSGLLARYGSTPLSLAVYGAVNVVASVLLLRLRHDVTAYGLSTAPADADSWFRSGWELWGNLVVFLLCIPGGYVLAGKGPFVLVLLFASGRTPGLGLRWWRWRELRRSAA